MTSSGGGPDPGFGDQAGEAPQDTEVEAPLDGDAAGSGAATAPGSAQTDPGVDPAPVDPADPEVDAAAEIDAARSALAERTLDLQRLQAEFVNYKRRVERDRELLRQNATYSALAPIVEVLDTIDRAREHEAIEGGFKSVVDQLERTVGGVGLVKFGEPGDAFDPTLHEALSHLGEDADVEVTTCKVIAKAGYRIGDRVVRAAQVLVVDPPA